MKSLLIFSLSLFSFAALSQPIGFFSNGRLENAQELPIEGAGYMKLYLQEDTGWGAPAMINLIINTAAEMDRKFPGSARLQIEDIGLKYGGPISGHGSHQNGLDVDLTYYRVDNKEHDPIASGQYYSDSMIIGNSVSANFDREKNWELVKALHRHGSINRIFMDQVLKRDLCQYARQRGEFNQNIHVLRSIRHVENHADHLHVRLKCPAGAKACRDQAPPPAGPGC